jgi:putative MATE family efflux protein
MRPRRDLTTGSLLQLIAQLAPPAAADSALMGISSLVHAYWMGRLGGTSIAAVAMGTTLRIVLISPMMGLSMGGMALIARFLGAREPRRADHALMQSLMLIVLFVIPIGVLGLLAGSTFLRWMGATDTLLAEATAYFQIICVGLFFMECLPSLNGVMRAAGYPEYILRVNIASIIAVLALEPLLVFGVGPFGGLGVRGAAWANVLSSAVGVAGQMIVILRGSTGLRLHRADLRPDLGVMRRILKVAIPTALQRFSPNLGNAVLTRLISAFGYTALTAYSVVNSVNSLFTAVGMGSGTAASALVGQNLGAKQPQRAERAALLTGLCAVVASVLLYSVLFAWPIPILSQINRTPEVLAVAVTLVPFVVAMGVLEAWSAVMLGAINGAGDALSSLIISAGALWLVQLPLSWALSEVAGWGVQGVWVGILASYAARMVGMTIAFRHGRWKTLKL